MDKALIMTRAGQAYFVFKYSSTCHRRPLLLTDTCFRRTLSRCTNYFAMLIPVPADTCLTRTADRAILDFVPGMKRTVVITVKYYDNFNDFGTPISVRYLVLFTIPNREAETAAIFNAKDVGRTGPRVQQATI